MSIYSAFDLQGTDNQNAIIKAAIDRITFPWDKITAIRKPIPVGWRDLNGTAAVRALERALPDLTDSSDPKKIPGHIHVEGPNGEDGHGVVRYFDAKNGEGARWWVAGVFWWGGDTAGIDLDIRCEAQPTVAQEVFSAEGAHFADLGMPYTQAMKDGITKLLHPDGLDAHTYWWPEDVGLPYGGQPYYNCMGESNMGLWTLAYSDMTPWQDAFPHKATKAMAPSVHSILGAAPVGTAPNSPVTLEGRSWITSFGNGRVELTWRYAKGTNVTVWENDVRKLTTANDGKCTLNLKLRRGSFAYQVRDAGANRSNTITVKL